MKISKHSVKVLDIKKKSKIPPTKAKSRLLKWIKNEIKKREKTLQKNSRISQEYCRKCNIEVICYKNAERKEFRRLHRNHELSFFKKLLKGVK